jgi:exosortase C (VPDSG-CTERM-specific)
MENNATKPIPAPNTSDAPQPPLRKRLIAFALAAGILVVAFVRPLAALVRFAVNSTLYSYLLLVPFIAGYLAWLQRGDWLGIAAHKRGAAVVPLGCGIALLAWYWLHVESGPPWVTEDALALATPSFVCLLVGIFGLFYGQNGFRALAFPLGFLLLLSPLPIAVSTTLQGALQVASAGAAHALFVIAGTPVFVQGLIFQLSDITLEVAPECSGLHSTLALFITSLVAGYLFLRSPWKRALLTVAVIPLAVARNGLRIFTIGELCVHVGPQMIDSWVHHHGGPFFFLLSLIPFFALVAYLVRSKPRVLTASRATASFPL